MGAAMSRSEADRPVEVEVERLPEREGRAEAPGRAPRAALDPIVAGIVIDVLDAVTRGPRGALLGLALGVPVGYWLGRRQGFDRKSSLGLGGLCGVYCALPGTAPVPLGAVLGMYRRFVQP